MERKIMHLFITGKVQGVYFRKTARQKAMALNLDGWVRNLPDGRVEIIAAGLKGSLDRFADWCRVGPPGAVVRGVELQFIAEEPAKGFEIR
jgi:acylphosphatase